jgi:predicted Holliday junction resolvase-like endonuclease
MDNLKMNASIKSLLDFYRTERRIFASCPHCRETFRLCEAKLTYGKEPPRDALTRLKKERDQLNDEIEQLESVIEDAAQEHELELGQVNARWESKVEVEVEKRLTKEKKQIRQDAIARSRVTTLGKTIERIAPMFSGFGYHPADVRPLYEPIDFVVFDGLWSRDVTELVFVEFKTGGSALSPVQRSIRDAVDRKRVRFEERRITSTTLRRIVNGNVRNEAIIQAKKTE